MCALHQPLSIFSKFRLLLWKNTILMRRHKWSAIIEIGLPLLVCCLLLYLRSIKTMKHVNMTDTASKGLYMMHKIRKFEIFERKLSSDRIAYAPDDNDWLNSYMQKFSTTHKFNPPVVFETTEQLEVATLRKEYFAAIDFTRSTLLPNMTPPIILNYRIRLPATMLDDWDKDPPAECNWKTDRLFPTLMTIPRTPYSTLTDQMPNYLTSFLTIEYHLNQAYVESLAKEHELSKVIYPAKVRLRRGMIPAFKLDFLSPFMELGGLPLLIGLMFLIPVMNTVRFIASENENHMKVVLIQMGLCNCMHWFCWFLRSLVISLLMVTLITTIFKFPVHKEGMAVFTYSEWSMLWLFLFTYSLSVIGFSFLMSVLFKKASIATAISGCVFVLMFVLGIILDMRNEVMESWEKLVMSVLMNTGLCFAFKVIVMMEMAEVGLNRENLWSTTTVENLTVGAVEVVFVLDFVLFWLIAIYVEHLFPGEYGAEYNWWYPLSRRYWCGGAIVPFEMDHDEKSRGKYRRNVRGDFGGDYRGVNKFGQNGGMGADSSFKMPRRSKSSSLICDSAELSVHSFTEDHTITRTRSIDSLPPMPTTQRGVAESDRYSGPGGVQMQGLSKHFGDSVVVKPMYLNIYSDHITILLGQNGSGKTTTMNMLMGILLPTRGTALVNGESLQKSNRSAVGMCPQKNVLFGDLKTEEHLYFFSRLKGFSENCIRAEVDKYLQLIDLDTCFVARPMADNMRRKLAVCNALCGDSSVVFLDEPTSGMDPCMRRTVWELLMHEKCGRTILMSTLNMDESDLLGDRIAILVNGSIKCYGSSYFLKRRYGTGFRLVCVKAPQFDEYQVTGLLQQHFETVSVEKNTNTELTYKLTDDSDEPSKRFGPMFQDLERNNQHLGLDAFGLTSTTIEEVFMAVGSQKPKLSTFSDINGNNVEKNTLRTPRIKNRKHILYLQTAAMMNKKYAQSIRNGVQMTLQLVVPIAIVVFLLFATFEQENQPSLPMTNVTYEKTHFLIFDNPSLPISKEYSDIYSRMFPKGGHVNLITIHQAEESGMSIWFNYVKDAYTQDPSRALHEILGGLDLTTLDGKKNNIEVWYNGQGYHAVAFILSTFFSVNVRHNLGMNYGIDVYNWPLPYTPHDRKHMPFNPLLSLTLGISMAFVSAFYVMPYIKERKSGAKQLQFMSGVRVYIFWITSFAWDFLKYIMIISILLLLIAVSQHPGWNTFHALALLFVVLLVFGWAMLPFTYMLSFAFTQAVRGFTRVLIFYLISGVALYMLVRHFTIKSSEYAITEYLLLESFKYGLLVFPHFALCHAVNNLGEKELWCRSECMMSEDCELENLCNIIADCCTSAFFSWEQPGIGAHLTIMSLVGLTFFVFVMLSEYKVKNHKVMGNTLGRKIGDPDESARPYLDDDVRAEYERVASLRQNELKYHDLVVCHIKKKFGVCKTYVPVKSVSFIVDGGECFGVVGKDGAGKSSLLRMLSGATSINGGNAWLQTFNTRKDMRQAKKRFGYVPQLNGLIDEMTGRETIGMHCALRGIPRGEETLRVTNLLAEELGFTQELDKVVKLYKSGLRRRLSAAVALCGDPAILYLDEPSNGMDANGKRCLWNILSKVRRMGKALLLSSHNMDECEALCTKLAIMVVGQFRCIGSIPHLRKRFAEGYMLIVKLTPYITEFAEETKPGEKREEKVAFTSTTKQTAPTMRPPLQKRIQPPDRQLSGAMRVHFHLVDVLPGIDQQYQFKDQIGYHVPQWNFKTGEMFLWSEIFAIMENAKLFHPNIEEYAITQTTLEQVFMKFGKPGVCAICNA